jgi:hypothetical protein
MLTRQDFKPFLPLEQTSIQPKSSVSTFGAAKKWLSECTRNHRDCITEQLFAPTRLIHVDQGAAADPRLCCHFDARQKIRYMTLSHCWGQTVPQNVVDSRLLEKNLDQMKQGIAVSSLPKTFQDAIVVCQSFGVSYIWIDSLCIIQDSEEDWLRESRTMGNVYSCSYCNISATSAADGSGGLFFDRDVHALEHLSVQLKGVPYYVSNDELWRDAVENAPLNQRAWVFQERFLSPRNLHFTTTQIFWECHGTSGCELFPSGFPDQIWDTQKKRLDLILDAANLRLRLRLPPDIQLYKYTIWNSIVATYTRGMLTYDTDKLLAIAGLAAKLQSVLEDKYVAGLWKRYLPSQLLWIRYVEAGTAMHCRTPSDYIAPSWSWASVIGEVKPSEITVADMRDILIHNVDAMVKTEGGDPFGQVKKGSIMTLQGRIARIAKMTQHGIGKDELISASIMTKARMEQGEQSILPILIFLDLDIASLTGRTADLYCLPVRADNRSDMDIPVTGLVLESTGTLSALSFQRCGIFKCLLSYLDNGFQFIDSEAIVLGLQYKVNGQGGREYPITLI